MPAPKVRSDPEELKRIADTFNREATRLRQMQIALKGKVNTLQGGHWISKGANTFYREMHEELYPTLERLIKALELAYRLIKRVREIMQMAEENAASLFKGNGEQAGGGAAIEEEEVVPFLGEVLGGLSTTMEGGLTALRQMVAGNPDALRTLRESMPVADYLALLPKLQIFETGLQPHTHPILADQYIQDALADYVIDAVGAGRQIAGQVSVVGDADWDLAGINTYGEEVWNNGKRERVGGFVDREGRVWIHKDKGNEGTVIHEGLHKYASNDMNRASHDLSEGVTEYFTRKTLSDVGLTVPRVNYQDNFEFASTLVDRLGESIVAAAYFDGDMNGLKNRFMNLGSGKTQEDWTTFLEHTKNERWDQAEFMLLD